MLYSPFHIYVTEFLNVNHFTYFLNNTYWKTINTDFQYHFFLYFPIQPVCFP